MHVIGGEKVMDVKGEEEGETGCLKSEGQVEDRCNSHRDDYVHILHKNIPCLWCSSFPLRRTETCLGLNLSV